MSKVYENCLDCPFHEVIPDPDPDDWFCDDDRAVVCKKSENPERDQSSRHASDHSPHRVILCAERPYNVRKYSGAPSWCPLNNTGKVA